jgi:NAD(P)-dependent dehydrogenase (short-subunit alcohol dehydrogenase family)
MSKRISVVTGATSGIGRAVTAELLRQGSTVFGIGRDLEQLDAIAQEFGLDGAFQGHVADMTDTDQIDRSVAEIERMFGQVDVLVNAAGILKGGNIENTSLEDWDLMMEINVRSVFYLMQKCVPLLEKVRGNVVNVSSVTGLRSFPNVLAYCVSKAAVDQLTRCSALELAPKGIRVNAVNPGVTITNLHKRGGMNEKDYEKFLENAKNTHPIGRAGEAKEVADLICFLASDKAGWITGATYSIDGGRALTCAR